MSTVCFVTTLTLTVLNHHTIIRAAFVCLCVCVFVPYLLRGPLTDLRQTWWVYVGGPPHLPLRGSFSKRSMGRRVNGSLSLSTILYMRQPHATQLQRRLCFAATAAESNSAPFAALHLNGVCTWTSQLPLRGSFSKRSTGRRVKRVNGSHLDGVCRWTSQLPLRGSFSKRSTGRWVKRVDGSTGYFHFHYIIYDSRRRQAHATPLQKHTAYDDTRLTHTTAKTTQRLLLARRVNFLVSEHLVVPVA